MKKIPETSFDEVAKNRNSKDGVVSRERDRKIRSSTEKLHNIGIDAPKFNTPTKIFKQKIAMLLLATTTNLKHTYSSSTNYLKRSKSEKKYPMPRDILQRISREELENLIISIINVLLDLKSMCKTIIFIAFNVLNSKNC